MRIEVTQDDINRGIRHHTAQCPIALAVRRTCPDAGSVRVSSVVALFRSGDSRAYCWGVLPLIAWQFIEAFDERHEGEPFAFDLEIIV